MSTDLTVLSLTCLLDHLPPPSQSRDMQETARCICLQLGEEMLCAHLGMMSTQAGCEAMD